MSQPAPLHSEIGRLPEGGEAFFTDTLDGVQIRFALWNGGHAKTAIIFPGRTEFIEKYGHALRALLARGYNCVIPDWRGQGLSERVIQHPPYGHVDDFRDYQKDLTAVLAHPVIAAMPKPEFLLAHSMGSLIALRSLSEGLPVKSAALNAPMWGVGAHPTLSVFVLGAARLLDSLGKEKLPVPFSGREPYALKHPFEGNVLTSDPEEYALLREILTAYPELSVAPPTFKWLQEAADEIARLKPFKLPALPTVVLLGTDETVIDSAEVHRRSAESTHCTLSVLEGARHETFIEKPAIRAKAWQAIERIL